MEIKGIILVNPCLTNLRTEQDKKSCQKMSNHDLNPHMLQQCWMSFQLHVLGLFSITVSPHMLAQQIAKEGKPEKWASFLEEKRMTQTLFHSIISQFLCVVWSLCVCIW